MGVGGVWVICFTSHESDFSIAYREERVCDGVTEYYIAKQVYYHMETYLERRIKCSQHNVFEPLKTFILCNRRVIIFLRIESKLLF